MKPRSEWKPLQRSPLKPRTTWLARGTKPVAKRNVSRKAREFARTYHSRERVEWVKALPCLVCVSVSPLFGLVAAKSHNAHTEGGGAGRKAGYQTIIPLCAGHHRRYDEHQAPCDLPLVRQAIKDAASLVEAAWCARG